MYGRVFLAAGLKVVAERGAYSRFESGFDGDPIPKRAARTRARIVKQRGKRRALGLAAGERGGGFAQCLAQSAFALFRLPSRCLRLLQRRARRLEVCDSVLFRCHSHRQSAIGGPSLLQYGTLLPRSREIVFKPLPALPRFFDSPTKCVALGLGPGASTGKRRKALLDRLNLGARLFSCGARRRLGCRIALGRAGKPLSDLVDALLRRIGLLGKRFFTFDVRGCLGAPARILLAGVGDALLLLGQPLMLDAEPMQGSGALGLPLAARRQNRLGVCLAARGLGGRVCRFGNPAVSII